MIISESDIDAVVALGCEDPEFCLLSEDERRKLAREFLVHVNKSFAEAAAKFKDNPESLVFHDYKFTYKRSGPIGGWK